MSFEIPESQTNENQENNSFEVMKTPEILIAREHGLELTSVLLKVRDSRYGDNESELSREIVEHFIQNEVAQDLSINSDEIFTSIKAPGVDEESLYMLSLLYEHPERTDDIFETIKEHKNIDLLEIARIQAIFFRTLDALKSSFYGTVIAGKMDAEAEKDIEIRKAQIEEIRTRFEKIINFFRPDEMTTKTKRVIFVPTNPILKRNSGRNFSLNEEQIIISHRENYSNQDHEFMHGIINPIVEKIILILTNEQEAKILEMASGKLKEGYGELPFSLLCEELVRTYNDVFKLGKRPESYEDFLDKISVLSDEQFREELKKNIGLKTRCEQFGISSRNEMLEMAREYFDSFEKNTLRELLFTLYEEYESREEKTDENFEQFLLKNLKERI